MSTTFDCTKDCKLLFDSAVRNESALILLRAKLAVIAQRLGISELKTENILLVASELVSNLPLLSRWCNSSASYLRLKPRWIFRTDMAQRIASENNRS